MHLENLLVKWMRDGGRRRHTVVCPCPDGKKAPAAATPSARQPTARRRLVRALRSDASASQWRSAGTRPCVPSRVGVCASTGRCTLAARVSAVLLATLYLPGHTSG